jgi:hypothetical protein
MPHCTQCDTEPCSCRALVKTGHPWIIQHCARPGCTTAIRTRYGLSESALVCKWCHATDHDGSPYAVYGRATECEGK